MSTFHCCQGRPLPTTLLHRQTLVSNTEYSLNCHFSRAILFIFLIICNVTVCTQSFFWQTAQFYRTQNLRIYLLQFVRRLFYINMTLHHLITTDWEVVIFKISFIFFILAVIDKTHLLYIKCWPLQLDNVFKSQGLECIVNYSDNFRHIFEETNRHKKAIHPAIQNVRRNQCWYIHERITIHVLTRLINFHIRQTPNSRPS